MKQKKKGLCQSWFLLLVASVSIVNFSCSTCSKDADCTNPGEICCAKNFTCSTREKCHRDSCIINSHCPAGKQCVNSRCTTNKKKVENFCHSDRDCYFRNATSSRHFKCCHERCEDVFLCFISTTKTANTRSGFSCTSWKDCKKGQQCEGGKCRDSSDITLTKAGFLSAAILTGSVFLLISCCCFVRESRYTRQTYAQRQRRRSRNRRRSRQGRRRSTVPNITAAENRAFTTDCERGFTIPPPVYPRDELTTSADDAHPTSLGEQAPSPPPYCSLSFDLPPSYEEALQTDENRSDLMEVT